MKKKRYGSAWFNTKSYHRNHERKGNIMAKVHGSGGSVTFAVSGGATSYSAGLAEWTLDDMIDAEDSTDFADGANGIHGFTVGLKNWTVSANGNWDAANVALVPGLLSGTLTLTVTSGKTYTATNPICTKAVPTVGADKVVKMSYEFIPGSALTRPS